MTLAARQEEVHLGRYLTVALHDALELEVVVCGVERGGVRRRVDDAERSRSRVLRRTGCVRVERVALVEQGLDELVHGSSSSATHASSVGSARFAFSRWSARSVCSRSAIQPVLG